jgi:hypothetical protein
MTIPLILQIQQAALESNTPVSDILLKAKVACTKLDLTEFGDWVDLELNGYRETPSDALANYRKLRGIPEVRTPYTTWQSIIFESPKMETPCSTAYIGMSMPEIEAFLKSAKTNGLRYFYNPEAAALLRKWLNSEIASVSITLPTAQVAQIANTVRTLILEWTMEMEKQGILGNDLTFNEEERAKSAAATAQTVNNIHIAQVGSFVQNADKSIVQGGVDAVVNMTGIHQLVKQVEELLPGADLPQLVKENTTNALAELKQVADGNVQEKGRLRRAAEGLSQALAPAGEHLLKIAVDSAITKIFGPG